MRIRFRRFRFASAISAAAILAGGAWGETSPLAEAIAATRPDTVWELRAAIPVGFPTFHPQGMTRVDDRWFLSSVEVINRAKAEGRGHLFEFDDRGALVRDLPLVEGAMYHPGGIDFDGESIWLSLAEYRPDSNSIVYRIDPETFTAAAVFEFADHLGAVVHLREARLLIGVNWGSRRIYEWETEPSEDGWRPIAPEDPRVYDNPSHYIGYQDMQQVPGTTLVLASGVRKLRAAARGLTPVGYGGMELLSFPGGAMRHGVPIPLATPAGIPMSQNPFYAELAEGNLRVWFMPEDDRSTVYVYSPKE